MKLRRVEVADWKEGTKTEALFHQFRENRIHRMPPSADRWKKRSTTFQGIANAMAAQWGGTLSPCGAST